MQDVAVELGIDPTGLSLNDSRVRALAGVPSGAISFADLRGKSAMPRFKIDPALISTPPSEHGYKSFDTGGHIGSLLTPEPIAGHALQAISMTDRRDDLAVIMCSIQFAGDTLSLLSGQKLQFVRRDGSGNVTDTALWMVLDSNTGTYVSGGDYTLYYANVPASDPGGDYSAWLLPLGQTAEFRIAPP